MNSNKLIVKDMIAEIQIGVFDDEKGRAQRVRFNIEAEPEIWPRHDNLDETISYVLIVEHIQRLTKNRHFHLVETLAEEIAEACLAEKIRSITVRVEKLDVFPFAIVGAEVTRSKG